MGLYGDPCCTEQPNTLSLFRLLLVVLAAELAHRNREGAGSPQHAAVFATVTATSLAPVRIKSTETAVCNKTKGENEQRQQKNNFLHKKKL